MRHTATTGLLSCLLLSAVLLAPFPAARASTIAVAEGDTLEQLAIQHGVSLEALIRVNGIKDPTLLQVVRS